jgi:hypothetical protein
MRYVTRRRSSATALTFAAVLSLFMSLVISMGATAGAVRDSVKPNLVVAQCTQPGQVKPSEIVLACGDGNSVAQQLHWRAWGRNSASGSGILSQNDCTPYCAAGTFHNYPAHFGLSDAVRAGGREYYTVVKVTFTGKVPSPYEKRSFSTSDCFVNPPAKFLPKCPANVGNL